MFLYRNDAFGVAEKEFWTELYGKYLGPNSPADEPWSDFMVSSTITIANISIICKLIVRSNSFGYFIPFMVLVGLTITTTDWLTDYHGITVSCYGKYGYN